MEIVPTSTSKHKNIDLEDLINRKAELRQKIKDH